MPKNIEQFKEERQNILTKLLDILEINDKNKIFSLHDLDINIDKQNAILNLEKDIKKYFVCSKWSYFNQKTKGFKRNYLSLIKSVLKKVVRAKKQCGPSLHRTLVPYNSIATLAL